MFGGPQTQEALIANCQRAFSRYKWELGESARQWHALRSFGKDSDKELAAILRLSRSEVDTARKVWERFGGSFLGYPSLSWNHFCAALNWDEWIDILEWADAVGANVVEMIAYRDAQRPDKLAN